MDQKALRNSMLVVWKAGDGACSQERFRDAVGWYKLAVQLIGVDFNDKKNAGKYYFFHDVLFLAILHRKMALCYFQLNEFEFSRDSVNECNIL